MIDSLFNVLKSEDSLQRIFEFIEANAGEDLSKLRLRCASAADRELIFFAIDQIDARRRFSVKLSDFLANREFLFPTLLAGEQASHRAVARYNADVAHPEGKVLDMTAGLGIDAVSMARLGADVLAVDIEPLKMSVLEHNIKVSGINGVKALCADSLEFLRKSDEVFDVIFVDPARRSDTGSRVFAFRDCQPDIISAWPLIASHARRVAIKASPMVDLAQVVEEIPDVKAIHVVSVKGECKELLIVCARSESVQPLLEDADIKIVAVDLADDGKELSRFEFDWSRRSERPSILEDKEISGKYLCIPGSGVMKTGAWGVLAESFTGMKMLSPNTHLFLSTTLPERFPGRVLKIEKILSGKDLKKLKGERRNVVSRNYPLTAAQLAKKSGIKEGGTDYLVGCRLTPAEHPLLLACQSA